MCKSFVLDKNTWYHVTVCKKNLLRDTDLLAEHWISCKEVWHLPPNKQVVSCVVIYEALCFDLAQGQMNGASNETMCGVLCMTLNYIWWWGSTCCLAKVRLPLLREEGKDGFMPSSNSVSTNGKTNNPIKYLNSTCRVHLIRTITVILRKQVSIYRCVVSW